jgi:hypothetical protein
MFVSEELRGFCCKITTRGPNKSDECANPKNGADPFGIRAKSSSTLVSLSSEALFGLVEADLETEGSEPDPVEDTEKRWSDERG